LLAIRIIYENIFTLSLLYNVKIRKNIYELISSRQARKVAKNAKEDGREEEELSPRAPRKIRNEELLMSN